jgi:hypothetical protein
MRMNGLIVDDVPKHLSHDENATHSIYIPEHDLCINLQMRGVLSVWPGRKPSIHEIETCTWVHMTPEASWDPHSEDFSNNESIASRQSESRVRTMQSIVASIYAAKTSKLLSPNAPPASLLDGMTFAELIKGTVTVSSASMGRRRATVQKEELMKAWGIVGLEAAERTIKATMQLVVRNALHPIQR